MLTETLSGKCPCCGYDKLFQRYGSSGYHQLEGCANCGFGYCTNHGDYEVFGVGAWLSFAAHVLSCSGTDGSKEAYSAKAAQLDALSDEDMRRKAFEWCEQQGRFDDVEKTIFKYTDEDVSKHRSLGLPVLREPMGSNNQKA